MSSTSLLAAWALLFTHVAATVVELDLIFPRNDTYAPVPLFPVVFAVQNPSLAITLDALVSWSVNEYGTLGSQSPHAYEHSINLQWLNGFSPSSPYLATAYIPTVEGIEGIWTFSWTLSSANCCENTTSQACFQNQDSKLVFTTNNTAPAPDLVMNETCSINQGFAFNVTGVEQLSFSHTGLQPSCAVLGASPTRQPCAATIDPNAASSISSALSLSACTATSVSCTAEPSSKSRGSPSYIISTAGPLVAMGVILLSAI